MDTTDKQKPQYTIDEIGEYGSYVKDNKRGGDYILEFTDGMWTDAGKKALVDFMNHPELQQENDRLRLALEESEKHSKEYAKIGLEQMDKVATLELALSGKTGYDQVEVERERLRKIIEAAKVDVETESKIFPTNTNGHGIRLGRVNAMEWFLSLLSSPVNH